MEILQTGELRRIGYERTEDVEATKVFQGIYGVGARIWLLSTGVHFIQFHLSGQTTAFKWYASGCRTLEDVKARKGDIRVTGVQEIGIRFYDG